MGFAALCLITALLPAGLFAQSDPDHRAAWTDVIRSAIQSRDHKYPLHVTVKGAVQFQDGNKTELRLVEVYCYGKLAGSAFPDASGRFDLECGAERGEPLASMMSATEVRARFPDYEASPLRMFGFDPRSRADLGDLILRRASAIEGRTISARTLAAPPAAFKAFENARRDLQAQRVAEARAGFSRAVELYPDFSEAWLELGRLQMAAHQSAAARASFEAAIRIEPRFVPPRVQMLSIELEARRWPELLAVSSEVVRLDPVSYPQAHFCKAAASFNLGDIDAAEASARETDRLDSRHRLPENLRLLGLIAGRRGFYDEAADWFRQYLATLAPGSPARAQVEADIAEVKRLASQPPQP